tara:strand:+ start:166 stop:348 length:183 start_codon:yes stop_codon:yes gene_type:complete
VVLVVQVVVQIYLQVVPMLIEEQVILPLHLPHKEIQEVLLFQMAHQLILVDKVEEEEQVQ